MSCSRELLEAVAALVGARAGARAHARVGEPRRGRGRPAAVGRTVSNLEYLADTGLATPQLCTAHCVWVTDAEQALLAERDVKVLHCPSSNLKLGSGIAPVAEMRARGISVSLGADGAACNNRLDMFDEMRLAATLQAVRKAPGALTARDASGWRRAKAPGRSGWKARSGRSSPASAPTSCSIDRSDPHLAPVAGSLVHDRLCGPRHRRPVDGRDGEMLVHEFALTRMDAVEVSPVGARPRLPSWRGVLVCNSVRFIMFSSRSLRVLNHDVDAS